MASLSVLHAVNHRLTNLPVKQLPAITASLAISLSNCGELLSSTQSLSQKSKPGKSDANSENAVQVHRLMTRLSSLLQDRSPEGRWTAVVLIKAAVEAGQWEILRSCEPLVRGLIAILTKPDPNSTKKMALITLTRIFHLTYQYPTLVREITTPSLPGFVTSALNLISVKASSEPVRRLKPHTPFVEIVLQALGELIVRHPTTFRPFSAQIHSVLLAIIGSTSPCFPDPVVDVAERLFVSLHHCAPKNASTDEWKSACHMTIASVHETAQSVFRSVVEQWESVDPATRRSARSSDYTKEVGGQGDALGLGAWQSVNAGVDRLVMLLRLLSTFLETPTASAVAVPIGAILDLTSRLTSLTVPSPGREVQPNQQISRVEREELFTELPRIHTACLSLLLTLSRTLESAVTPVGQTILEQTLWVFPAERFSRQVRSSTYELVQELLPHLGPTMSRQSVSALTGLIRACCSDLLPPTNDQSGPAADTKGKAKPNPTTANADSFLNPTLKQTRLADSSSSPDLHRTAVTFLPAVLMHAPTEHLSPALRAEIDRTIILTADKDAMLASVLNPMPAMKGRAAAASILPFLARSAPTAPDVEALIRPHMPVLIPTSTIGTYDTMDESESESESDPKPTTTIPSQTKSGFLQTSSSATMLQPAAAPQQAPAPQMSKRTYEEEPQVTRSQPPVLTAASERSQSKKPRVAAENPSPSVAAASPATFTGTAAIPAPVPSEITAAAAPAPVSTGGVVASAEDDDEDGSEDDLPALNVDPDTDDDDDDVSMDG
ncbi:rRNA processing/ribosome biogenesis-domain-containing protein [Aspergillus taichungensis]|uniref:Pre-rRNA-processing protein RIX1 n=1 Tax=Aspergillus taichungensis TaxID=482145 RepID=A0A2J5HXP9_9EURO|nr:rRNA processing/ribosome biogenesis-domain-containing protein [Aspergillus taichungensis]